MDRKDVNTTTAQILLDRRIRGILAVVCLLGFSGCGLLGLDGSSSASAPADQSAGADADDTADSAPVAPAQKTADKDDAPEYERPEYPNQVRRNPFLPNLEVIKPKKQIDKGDIRPLEPLEKFGIGQLQLVAIISEVAVPKAMFLVPGGFGYVIKEGDRIGQRGGTVTDIRDNEVEIRETAAESDSQTRLTTVDLRDEALDIGDEDQLDPEQRQMLRRLMGSKRGRQAVRESMKQSAAQPSGTPAPQAQGQPGAPAGGPSRQR